MNKVFEAEYYLLTILENTSEGNITFKIEELVGTERTGKKTIDDVLSPMIGYFTRDMSIHITIPYLQLLTPADLISLGKVLQRAKSWLESS